MLRAPSQSSPGPLGTIHCWVPAQMNKQSGQAFVTNSQVQKLGKQKIHVQSFCETSGSNILSNVYKELAGSISAPRMLPFLESHSL
jgi:hypothetical protein